MGTTSSKIAPRHHSKHSIRRIFLGGACGSTTWRQALIPVLESKGIEYYNPQVPDGTWHAGLMAEELYEKEVMCDTLLFVIGSETRGIASMVEAAYYAGTKNVLLVIEPYPEDGLHAYALACAVDVNRGRTYLRQLAENKSNTNIRLFESVLDVGLYL